MKGDFSRLIFDPKRHYSGVRMQQGRVQLDADWNEQVDITEHRIENLFTDLIGDSGAPKGDHFKISLEKKAENEWDITIGKGRIYVAGLLCENDEGCSFSEQPYLPGVKLPKDEGDYLCYLDVWQRLITVLEDSNLREPALGGTDTAARVQNVWQVKFEKVGDENKDEFEKTLKGLKENAISTGKMTAKWDCQSAPPENRLYRVEIHKGGASGTATFKWSRDNGAIAARVDSITPYNNKGHIIVLSQEGPATESWFAPNEHIEFSNEALTLNREPGILAKLARVEGLTLTTENTSDQFTEGPGNKPIVRRWDSSGEVKVEATDNDGWIELEHGIRVRFKNGNYKTGDYWLIPSRRNYPRGIMFPKEAQPPKGVQHYYSPLALLKRKEEKWELDKNLLAVFSPLTTGWVSKGGDIINGKLEIEEDLHVNGKVGIGTTDPSEALDVKTGRIKDITGFVMPVGGIIAWHPDENHIERGPDGKRSNIKAPEGWAICDGTNGTPDLTHRFICGTSNTDEVGMPGGDATHTHKASDTGKTFLGTSHAISSSSLGGTIALTSRDHTHHAPSIAQGSNLPPHIYLVYIMKK